MDTEPERRRYRKRGKKWSKRERPETTPKEHHKKRAPRHNKKSGRLDRATTMLLFMRVCHNYKGGLLRGINYESWKFTPVDNASVFIRQQKRYLHHESHAEIASIIDFLEEVKRDPNDFVKENWYGHVPPASHRKIQLSVEELQRIFRSWQRWFEGGAERARGEP